MVLDTPAQAVGTFAIYMTLLCLAVQEYCLKFHRTGLTSKQLLISDDHNLHQSIVTERPVDLKDERYERLAPRLSEYIKELNRTGVIRLLLWKEYCQQESDPYSYQQFCFHLGNHHRIHSAVMYFSHIAGEKAEIDFAGAKLSQEKEKEVLVITLLNDQANCFLKSSLQIC